MTGHRVTETQGKNLVRSLCLRVSVAVVLALVAGAAGSTAAAGRSTFDLLKERFNRDVGVPRLVLLTSPTCPACVGGADWVQTEVLNQYPDVKLRVYTVW